METYITTCEPTETNGYVCAGTSTPISDDMATSSLALRNQISVGDIMISGFLIFIAFICFLNFIFDVLRIKKMEIKLK